MRRTDATGGSGAEPAEVPGSMSTGPRSMFFLKPTSKVEHKVSTVIQKNEPRCRKLNENQRLLKHMFKNTMTNQDYEKNEGLNPASAYKFPEAYCESRKKVSTVTHSKRES